MRIAVIGGTGHIGTYLVPRLVRAGHDVVSVSRGQREPYTGDEAWEHVTQVRLDREAEERGRTFGARVADLGAETVVDLVCFTPESARHLVEALRGRVTHLVHCGSIWRHGPSLRVPVTEDDESPPVGEYGTAKAAIAHLLAEETRSGGLVTTTLHPGHISGPGWMPIGPLGNLDPGVWTALAAGDEIAVPGLGAELMHHVHADDVAQGFHLAAQNREAAAGEAFNVVASSALTVRGLLQLGASWFGREPRTRSVSWDEFRAGTTSEYAGQSWDHLVRSHYASIDKARSRLGYEPAHAPEDAVLEAVRWLVDHGRLDVGDGLRV